MKQVDKIYLSIEDKTIKVCEDNAIDFYDYLGVFVNLLDNYIKAKKFITVVEKINFFDKVGTRAILNKASFQSKEKEIYLAKENFENQKKKLFSWLDKTTMPYFFILNPVFIYGAGLDYKSFYQDFYGYKKIRCTGVQNTDVAFDYAVYNLIFKK